MKWPKLPQVILLAITLSITATGSVAWAAKNATTTKSTSVANKKAAGKQPSAVKQQTATIQEQLPATVAEGSSLFSGDAPPPSTYDKQKSGMVGNQQLVSEDNAFMAEGIKSLLVLTAVIALIYLCLRLLKIFMVKTGLGSSNTTLKAVARVGLDQKTMVHVVQAGQRYFLVGSNEHAISLLAELDPADVNNPNLAGSPLNSEVKSNG